LELFRRSMGGDRPGRGGISTGWNFPGEKVSGGERRIR